MKNQEDTRILRLLGTAIKQRRQELDISQEDLAARAGLNRTYIGDIERGARNVAFLNLVRLARALDMDLGDLVSSAAGLRGKERARP